MGGTKIRSGGTVCVGGGGGCSKGTNVSCGPSSSFDKASTMSSSLTGAIGGSLDGEGPSRVKVGYVTSVADRAGTEVVMRGGGFILLHRITSESVYT